jgi:hypothetical protein
MKFDSNNKKACVNCHLVPEKVKKVKTEEDLNKEVNCKLCNVHVKRNELKAHKESEQHTQLQAILEKLQTNLHKLPEYAIKLNT